MRGCHVKSFIYYEHHRNDYVTEHSHNCYECVFYMDGSGIITARGDVYEYDGATMTVTAPHVKHDEKTGASSHLFILLFEAEGLESVPTFSALPLSPETARYFCTLFRKMQGEEKEKKPFYQETIDAYFSLALCTFLRESSANEKKRAPDQELVRRVKNYIKENYNQAIDFTQIASSFGYSYDRLRHIFTRETGTSIHQYLLNCKLYAAKQLLLTTGLPVKDVAARCGFGSSVHFNNFFKQRMHISPRQFRDSQKNTVDVGVFHIQGERGGSSS